MNNNVLIIGSTGKLGSKLLNYCSSEKINILCATCFNNYKKLKNQKNKHSIKNIFKLSNINDRLLFIEFLKVNKFKLIYFLDYGSDSLRYINVILKTNKNSYLAIANKEMIIAGGSLLINKINKFNFFLPLDSEHYSLNNLNLNSNDIKKIFITASGGPFYFKKNVDLNFVNKSQVLNHPKWKMGINNSIDSSNFINKILEIFELSFIYNIDLKKIDFLISKEAFVHSLIFFKDNTYTLNCFNNNMLITLVSPLIKLFKSKNISFKNDRLFDMNNFKIERYNDVRFKIFKRLNYLKSLSHGELIMFMLLNNKAQQLYLNNNIKYNDIVDFIIKNLKKYEHKKRFNSITEIINYIELSKNQIG